VSRPNVKVYRYRVRPESVERCLDVWALQSSDDSDGWLEPNVFPAESAFRRGVELVDAEPKHHAVWRDLASALLETHVERESSEEVARFP
jgi:hypothetical protein